MPIAAGFLVDWDRNAGSTLDQGQPEDGLQ